MRNKSGFTLVEMMAATITIGVLSAMMYSIFLGAWMNFEMELTRIDLAQEAGKILGVVEEDVMEAVGLSLNAGNLVIDYPDPIRIDPANAVSAPIFGGGTRGNFPESQIVYQLTVPSLTRTGSTTGMNMVLSNRIDAATNFVLENNPAFTAGRLLTITLALKDDVFGQPLLYNQIKEVVVRNRN